MCYDFVFFLYTYFSVFLSLYLLKQFFFFLIEKLLSLPKLFTLKIILFSSFYFWFFQLFYYMHLLNFVFQLFYLHHFWGFLYVAFSKVLFSKICILSKSKICLLSIFNIIVMLCQCSFSRTFFNDSYNNLYADLFFFAILCEFIQYNTYCRNLCRMKTT